MADDLPSSLQPRDLPVQLRDEGGVQWVALPAHARFTAEEVTVSEDRWGVTVQARRTPPMRTPADWAEFWAQIDAHKTGGPEDDWPEIDDPPPEDKDLTW